MRLRWPERFRFKLSYWQKVALPVFCGALEGLGGLFLYLLRAHTYLGDEQAACVNCHIMTPYYAAWSHSSRGLRLFI